jgi:hypothetical protein
MVSVATGFPFVEDATSALTSMIALLSLFGKSYRSSENAWCQAIQVVGKDGLIHRTWPMEDWATAQAQLLGKAASVDLGFDPAYLNFKRD